jgi:NTE family protein
MTAAAAAGAPAEASEVPPDRAPGAAPGPAPAAAPGTAPGIGPTVALALGGGSARGLAHIVVLEALDELGVKPVAIAGTSMGAICGALYAAGVPGAEIRAGFLKDLASSVGFMRRYAGRVATGLPALWRLRRPGVVDTVTLFEMLLPDILRCDFAALKVPFMAVAADLGANDQVVLSRGPLIPAIAASCAIPAWARPVVIEGRVLVDGGYVNPVPFDVVIDKADITIAVDVTGDPRHIAVAGVPPRQSVARWGAVQLLFHAVIREKLKTRPPAILIRPAVGNVGSADFFRITDILAAAEPSRDEVKRKLAQCIEGRF